MIYYPAEDSLLIKESVKIYSKDRKVIDIGSGSGILTKTAMNHGARDVLASDIDEESISYLNSQGLPAIKSDLFSRIKGKFDLIIFNPPYLPEDRREDKESRVSTTGGKRGDEIILRFLKQSLSHLSNLGIILLLLSSFTPRKRIKKLMKALSFSYRVISSRRIFFEKLEILKITAKP